MTPADIKKRISKRVITSSSEETRLLGKTIGRNVEKKLLIKLSGDLGAGKTAFVQGVAQGLDVANADYVTSPTFSLINWYLGRLPLYHVDLYRIDELSALDDTGIDEILDADGVVAVEWAEKFHHFPKTESISVHFEFASDDPDDTCRLISFNASEDSCLLRLIE